MKHQFSSYLAPNCARFISLCFSVYQKSNPLCFFVQEALHSIHLSVFAAGGLCLVSTTCRGGQRPSQAKATGATASRSVVKRIGSPRLLNEGNVTVKDQLLTIGF